MTSLLFHSYDKHFFEIEPFGKGIALYLCAFLLLFVFHISQGQPSQSKQVDAATFVVTPAIGLSWRSTTIGLFRGNSLVRALRIPYNYEKNIQGISLNPSINVYIRPARLAIEYAPNLRYDHLHNVWSNSCHLMQLEFNPRPMCHYPLLEEVTGFIIDHNFNFFIRLSESKDKRKTRVGLGLSFVNSGEDFTSRNGQNYWNLAFTTYNLLFQIPIKKHFMLEPKVLYIPHGFPEGPGQKHLTFSIRTFYNFRALYL